MPTQAEVESSDLRMFEPAGIRLLRVAGVMRLTWVNHQSWIRVAVARAFPVSDPNRYVGFLDGEGKEIGLIRDPSQLDPDSRKALEEELELHYFVPVVRQVVSVKEEFGAVYWDVETDRGRREIVVRNLKDNLQELPGSRVIITDVDENRFEFPDINRLDGASLGIILRNL